jgi:hypothetical protein
MERGTRTPQLKIEQQRNGSVIIRGTGSLADRATLAKSYLQRGAGQNASADAEGHARQAMLDGLAREEWLRRN